MKNIYFLLFSVLYLGVQCESFVSVEPPQTRPTDEDIFTDSLTAASALDGLYSGLANKDGGISGKLYSISVLLGLTSDELQTKSPLLYDYYTNSVTGYDSVNLKLFANAYNAIYTSNAILENAYRLRNQKDRFIGEALFVRAFCYFYLVNLFGDVPYTTTTDFEANMNQKRVSKDVIYQHIIADLIQAKSILTKVYFRKERIYPNYWAATALLARVYLYRREWNSALNESTEIINNGLFSLEPVEKVFLKESKETIFQLISDKEKNTWAGTTFILPRDIDTLKCKCKPVPPDNIQKEEIHNKVWLYSSLLYYFDKNDLRLQNWVGTMRSDFDTGRYYFFPTKYKKKYKDTPQSEYYIVFRLAEQYLIRAEAKASIGDISGALDDLNILRSRCGLPALSVNSYKDVMELIKQERRFELFTEWGHRWFDVNRWGISRHVYSYKVGYSATDQLMPIPWSEIRINGWQQNSGY